MEDGGISWCEEYEVLRRKYELICKYWSVCHLKEKIKMRNNKVWKGKYTARVYLKENIKMRNNKVWKGMYAARGY